MWFFMNLCYILSLLSFATILIAFSQSFLGFPVFKAGEITFIIFTSILYFLTETLVIFFFVGTGVSVKEYTLEKKKDPAYHHKSIAIKRKVYPPLLLNILLMIVLFSLAGAVDTEKFPRWGYQTLFAFCICHYIYAKIIQHQSFRKNTENILAMVGMKLPA
ncbi:MAG: hypothetical protein NUV91_08385 [Candidatus Omnitrophica bacterium]|nr:hypothetical protein [Candidatus Omnitrophota bacterium]